MSKVSFLLLFLSYQILANQQAGESLDQFHRAAASADFDSYFEVFAEDGIFMGTDASERWTKKQFKDYVKGYFEQGKGWLYQPTSRHFINTNNADILVFDELLNNSNYGQCRGTGVLIKNINGWQILQYNLSITVPNGVAKQVVNNITQFNNHRVKK